MTLNELQKQLHDVVRGTVSTADGAARLGVNARRLGLYPHFANGHIRSALDNVYEILAARLGEGWSLVADRFAAESPPSHWALNHAAEAFPEWLAERLAAQPDCGIDPFFVSLAQFEWEQYAVMVDPAELDGGGLNPTLSLLDLPYPVVPFAVDSMAGEHPEIPEPEPGIALLWRHPESHNCVFRTGTDGLMFVIKVVHEGISVADAALAVEQPVELVERLLADALASGLILGS